MNLHLVEISRTVAPGAYAVVLMDQAGWHMTNALIVPEVPENINILTAIGQMFRAQSSRKYRADHAGQLALQPRLRIL